MLLFSYVSVMVVSSHIGSECCYFRQQWVVFQLGVGQEANNYSLWKSSTLWNVLHSLRLVSGSCEHVNELWFHKRWGITWPAEWLL